MPCPYSAIFVTMLGSRIITYLGVFALPLAVYLRTFAPTITWQHDGADGGDLIAATATLGIPHPTGYPTYVLLGRVFLLIPWGDPAHRLNLMSAVSAALTVFLLSLTIWRTLLLFGDGGDAAGGAPLSAVGAGLSFAFSPLFWSQALIAEVYALHAFFVALTVYLLVRWLERGRWELLAAAAFACGVGLGNHMTILLLLPTAPLLLLSRQHPRRGVRDLAFVLAPLLLGLGVYLYLPLRAGQHPPINWGAPHTWQGFRWMLSGSLYRRFLFGLPISYLPARLTAWLGLLSDQFGWWGILLGLAGWVSLWHKKRGLALFSSTLFLGYSVYAVGYNTTDSHVYLIPAFLFFALWLGWGLGHLLAKLSILMSPTRSGLLRAAPICLALALPVSSLVGNFSALDLSHDHTARDYGLGALAVLPSKAIVISQADAHTFTLWYFCHAEMRCSDIAVLDGDLLHYAWYRHHMSYLYPHIAIEEANTSSVLPILALIEANLDCCPIYLTDPDDHVRSRYQLSQEGPLYRLVSPLGSRVQPSQLTKWWYNPDGLDATARPAKADSPAYVYPSPHGRFGLTALPRADPSDYGVEATTRRALRELESNSYSARPGESSNDGSPFHD